MTTENKKEYTADDIRVLDGLEGVRKRPAMYIGSTSKDGLHHLVYEIVDNGVDEALAGFCNKIVITIEKDGSITVEDNGRGIPVEKHKQTGKSTVETVLTILHAGGKFEHKAYMISGGLHGVGASVVNAVCKKFIVTVKRDGKIYEQQFSRGKTKTELKVVGKTKEENETGTTINFLPDDEIFSVLNFDFSTLLARFREIAFLNPGLKIILKDEIKDKKEELFFEGGLIEFVKWINKGKEVIHKPIYFKKQVDHTVVEVSIQYNTSYNDNIHGFVNTINTVEGGTHIVGFKTALTRVINNYATKNKVIKNATITGDDTKEGLTAIVSIKIRDPQFEGQTKTKLGNSEVKGFVDSIVSASLSQFFEENPSIAKKIAEKVSAASKAREAAKKARDLVRRKNAFGLSGLPGKLADCSSNKLEETEMFIVEGESAGGSSKMGRNKEFQAILPLKGKILNVEKAQPTKVLSSQEIVNLITAIGTGVGEEFNIEKLRYGKIIIMTDADVDGQHIKTLLLTFFYRYLEQLIENGNIFVAVPPLYKIRKHKDHYVYSDKGLKLALNKLGQGKNVNVQRFKGLGEMNSQQLWETTMNPNTRTLKKVMVEDAVEANETIETLMGDDVAPRKAFIEEHAKEATLDL